MNITGIKLALIAAVALVAAACTDDAPKAPAPDGERAEKVRIAVILPQDASAPDWNRVLSWVRDNIRHANSVLEPEYEIYDENTADLEELAMELASREDITAIIGCHSSAATEKLARKCAVTYKPVFTYSTSAELPRAFGRRGFLWMLSESDISQSELLLVKASASGAKTVGLLAEDGIYGQTFTDWFAFQASELGMEPLVAESYSTSSGIESAFARVAEAQPEFLICAPASTDEACRIVRAYRESEFMGRLLFSDTAYSDLLISDLAYQSNNIEGIAPAPDPSGGFEVTYRALFDEAARPAEAYVYDAVMIICYASRYAAVHGLDINDAIAALLDREGGEGALWTREQMEATFASIEAGDTPALSGASGKLDFSTDNYTSVLTSTYVHWMAYEGSFISLDYDVRSGGSGMYAAWEWNKQYMQEFDPADVPELTYGPLEGNYAVVVAASEGWSNYRHQADALAFYQLLRSNGYDDDHILLIMADDLAGNPLNPEPGVLRRTEDGENLYSDVRIDYRLDELEPADLLAILSGDKADAGFAPGAGDNVLLFWSGHGEKEHLIWGEDNSVTGPELAASLSRMQQSGRFRKMLCFFETCYSGSVAEACEGIPGILMFTAANPLETSKADVYSSALNVWMTNRFTSVLLAEATANPAISLRALYSAMFHRTLGSHVCVYNVGSFGSVYENAMREFLIPFTAH